MANRSKQWGTTDPTGVSAVSSSRPAKRAWLELLMPVFAAALLVVFHKPQYMPRVFVAGATSPVDWAAWAALGAMGGVLFIFGLMVVFFLLYSPIYLVGKASILMGGSGWIDPREVRFYIFSLVMLVVLLGLLLWDWRWFVSAFLLVTGFAPTLWRALV